MGNSADAQRSAGARLVLLREAIANVSLDRAACLVGILFECQLVLKVETWNPRSQEKLRKQVRLAPLEPQAAAELVATAFNLDCDLVYCRFVERWAESRQSPMTGSLLMQLSAHAMVDHIEDLHEL